MPSDDALQDAVTRAIDAADRGLGGRHAAVLGYFPHAPGNPYQELLYSGCTDRGVAVVRLRTESQLARLPEVVPEGRQAVLHIHWTYRALRDAASHQDARKGARRFIEQLTDFKEAGVRLMWTVHNVLPHDCEFPDVEARMRSEIAELCDLVHVMCPAVPDLVAHRYELPAGRTVVLPHPTYEGWYPTMRTRAVGRDILKVDAQTPLLVAIGNIRPYKGYGRLLDAFAEVRDAWEGPCPPELLMAGEPQGDDAGRALQERVVPGSGVTVVAERLSTMDLATYLSASDVVVLPYEHVLNSGVLLAAMTFLRTSVIPNAGCLTSVAGPDIGVPFRPGDTASLAWAMTRALALAGLPEQEARIAEAIKPLHPRIVAAEFAELVQGRVLQRRGSPELG